MIYFITKPTMEGKFIHWLIHLSVSFEDFRCEIFCTDESGGDLKRATIGNYCSHIYFYELYIIMERIFSSSYYGMRTRLVDFSETKVEWVFIEDNMNLKYVEEKSSL